MDLLRKCWKLRDTQVSLRQGPSRKKSTNDGEGSKRKRLQLQKKFLIVNEDINLFLLVGESVATPLWRKCEVTTHTPEIGSWESSGTPKNSGLDCRGRNTLHWDVLYTNEKRSWSVNVQNGLAWTIWTFATQLMVEKRAGTGSLTPYH